MIYVLFLVKDRQECRPQLTKTTLALQFFFLPVFTNPEYKKSFKSHLLELVKTDNKPSYMLTLPLDLLSTFSKLIVNTGIYFFFSS